MSEIKWRIRVMYYLPADRTESDVPPYGSAAQAYLEILSRFQNTPKVEGYSEFSASGFWRSPEDQLYFSEVRILAVDYEDENEERLNLHIERMKRRIARLYDELGCHQQVLYVLSQDVMVH